MYETPSYVVDEADRNRAYQASLARMDRLTERLKDEHHPLWLEIDTAASALPVDALMAAHARLVRMLPHLADVLALGIWRETIEFPEMLDQYGRPLVRAAGWHGTEPAAPAANADQGVSS